MLVYRQRIWKWVNRGLIAVLLAALGLPLLGMLRNHGEEETKDRRKLAEMPQLRLSRRSLLAFPQGFEAYFNDHFGYRSRLIGWSNRLKVHALKVSTSPHVIIGRDGWLFYTHFATCGRPGRYTPEQLEAWRHVLERRQQWLADRGCRYLFIVPPTKQTIYPEYLPSLTIPYSSPSRMDQLIAHLRSHSTVPVVDARAALLEAKTKERIYYRTDSHWNGLGAFPAYQEVGRQLSEWFPSVQPLPRSAFRNAVVPGHQGDLAGMLGAGGSLEETDYLQLIAPSRVRRTEEVLLPRTDKPLDREPYATEKDDPRLPRAVMFHDSFNNSLQPFLSEHFRRIAFYWTENFLPQVIEHERPDVVLQEIVEWKLDILNPLYFQQ